MEGLLPVPFREFPGLRGRVGELEAIIFYRQCTPSYVEQYPGVHIAVGRLVTVKGSESHPAQSHDVLIRTSYRPVPFPITDGLVLIYA